MKRPTLLEIETAYARLNLDRVATTTKVESAFLSMGFTRSYTHFSEIPPYIDHTIVRLASSATITEGLSTTPFSLRQIMKLRVLSPALVCSLVQASPSQLPILAKDIGEIGLLDVKSFTENKTFYLARISELATVAVVMREARNLTDLHAGVQADPGLQARRLMKHPSASRQVLTAQGSP